MPEHLNKSTWFTDIQLVSVNLKIKARSSAEITEIYEAAIKHFIMKLPLENRPTEGEEIDVTTWVKGNAILRPNR